MNSEQKEALSTMMSIVKVMNNAVGGPPKREMEKVEQVIEYIKNSNPEWNPIKYRPMTEEEVRKTEERWGIKLTIDERVCFDCSMPEDDQEILVCTSWGHIFIDRCELDPDDGYALEENGDWDGIVAWMPLPEPYTEE